MANINNISEKKKKKYRRRVGLQLPAIGRATILDLAIQNLDINHSRNSQGRLRAKSRALDPASPPPELAQTCFV